MSTVFFLLSLLPLLLASPYNIIIGQNCGSTIHLDSINASNGFITVYDAGLKELTCNVRIQSDEKLTIGLQLIEVNFPSCSQSEFSVISVLGPAEEDQYPVFNTYPHFCGQRFSPNVELEQNEEREWLFILKTKPEKISSEVKIAFSVYEPGKSPIWPSENDRQQSSTIVQLNDLATSTPGKEMTPQKPIMSSHTFYESVTSTSFLTTLPTRNQRTLASSESTLKNTTIDPNRCTCLLEVVSIKQTGSVKTVDLSDFIPPTSLKTSSCTLDKVQCDIYCKKYVSDKFGGLMSFPNSIVSVGGQKRKISDLPCDGSNSLLSGLNELYLASLAGSCNTASFLATHNQVHQATTLIKEFCCKGPNNGGSCHLKDIIGR